jgi:ATP-dependent RNA helicase DeaD
LKTKIKTVFHHLTKDELIELLANYLQNKNEPVEKPVKDKKNSSFFFKSINHCNA